MADNKITSLLGRPGQDWGDLAASYISNTGKKKNKARNILLGSLFFNAAEATRQGRVADRLRSQEIENAALEAKLSSQFQKQIDLIEADQAIKSKTKEVYFKPQAEEAFNAALESGKLESLFGPDGGLENGNELKRKWMASWIEENPYADHQAQMQNIDVKTAPRTLEAFSAEAKDYMYKKGKQIRAPQNVSLVHKALGFIGIGKSDAEYNEEVLLSKKALDEKQTKINNFYKYDVGENQKSKINLDIDNQPVNIKYVREQFQNLGITNPVLEQQFIQDVKADGMTLADVQSNLTTYALDTRAIEFKAMEEDLNKKIRTFYGAENEDELQQMVTDGVVKGSEVKRMRKENRLVSLGLTRDKMSAAIEAAEGWVEVIAEGNPDKQKEMMTNYFNNIEESQFISPDEARIRDASSAIFKIELSNINEDQRAYMTGSDGGVMQNIIASTELPSTAIKNLTEDLQEGGPNGLQILEELKAVNFNLNSDLNEDSTAYKVLANAYGTSYFKLRTKQAQATARSFDVNATAFLSTKELLGQPKLKNSLNLNIPTSNILQNATGLSD